MIVVFIWLLGNEIRVNTCIDENKYIINVNALDLFFFSFSSNMILSMSLVSMPYTEKEIHKRLLSNSKNIQNIKTRTYSQVYTEQRIYISLLKALPTCKQILNK